MISVQLPSHCAGPRVVAKGARERRPPEGFAGAGEEIAGIGRRRSSWNVSGAMLRSRSPPRAASIQIHPARIHRAVVVPAAFVIVCLAHDWRRYRVVHPVYVIGGAVIIASWPWRYMAARQEWYQPIGEAIARLGAGY
jgi:hypothetical protein